MSWVHGLGQRIREILRPSAVDAELEEELRDHLERERARQESSGAGSDAARRAVLRAGRPDIARENAADARSGRVMADAVRDLRYAGRAIRRNPGFAAAVILSLGLGVGGTTAIFSVVDAVLLRPLPFAESDRLYRARIWWGDFNAVLSVADYLALTETSKGVAEIGAFFYPDSGFAVAGRDGAEVLHGLFVTTALPRVLRIAPILGPGLGGHDSECQALIGQDLWGRRFAGRGDAIGASLTLDDTPCTIVGVMARGFHVPGERDDEVWVRVPLQTPKRRGGFYMHTIVRVPPGIAPEQVAARLTTLVIPVLRDRYGIKNAWQYRLTSERELIVGDVRETLLVLFAGVGLVLLVATFNVANLLLARGLARTRELAVRASLGASRRRLAQQLLTEALLLGLAGGALGLAIAAAALRMAGHAASAVIPRMHEVQLDSTIVAFSLATGLLAGLVAGALPVMRLPWTRLGGWLREGGRTTGESAHAGRLRTVLVICEIALTLMVLTASALLTKSLLRLQRADPAFRTDHALAFLLSLPDDPYKAPGRTAAFLDTLESRLRGLPAVSGVAVASSLPPDLLTFSNNYVMEGKIPDSAGGSNVADWNLVSASYFKTLGIALLGGREFTRSDLAESTNVAIVNEAFVGKHFPDGHALGRRFKAGDWDPALPWTTIVGVVRDVPYDAGGVWNGVQPMIYTPLSGYQSPYVVIRSAGDPLALVAPARAAVREIDPRLPLRDVTTLEDEVLRSTAVPRLRGGLFAALGAFALALAATGIYGVMAYHVNRRRRDTAIRRALGASGGQVVASTLGMGLRIIGYGSAIGVAAAWATAKSLSSMLFRVDPHDPAVIAAAAGLVSAAAFTACLVPAVRAAHVDPATLLRDE